MPRDPVTARRDGEGTMEEREEVPAFLMEIFENTGDVRPCSGPGPLHGRTSLLFLRFAGGWWQGRLRHQA